MRDLNRRKIIQVINSKRKYSTVNKFLLIDLYLLISECVTVGYPRSKLSQKLKCAHYPAPDVDRGAGQEAEVAPTSANLQ